MTAPPRPLRPAAPAFTLVEVMVVVIILAIMAALTLPRMFGNNSREQQLVVDRIADLLMMFAQRESLGSRPVGLWEDVQNRRLALVVLERDEEFPDEEPAWVIDRTVRPVELPRDTNILDVHADGASTDISAWPLQVEPGQMRPDVAIMLEGPAGVVTVSLAGHALAPHAVHSERYQEWLGGPIDLDAAGRDREDW